MNLSSARIFARADERTRNSLLGAEGFYMDMYTSTVGVRGLFSADVDRDAASLCEIRLMIELTTPRALPVHVPEVESEDPSPRFMAHESKK